MSTAAAYEATAIPPAPSLAQDVLDGLISAKFTWSRLERDLRAAGLALERWFTDPQRRFAVTLARR